MKTLSLDASTRSTGWAVFEDATLVAYGCITAASADLINRIHKMTDGIENVLIKYPGIEQIILEEVRPEIGPQTNQKTHKALMYLQAAIEIMLHDKYPKIKIIYTYPSEWRKACGITTGRGVKRNSLKAADVAYVQQLYNVTVNDDVADSICIGYSKVKATQNKAEDNSSNEINWE